MVELARGFGLALVPFQHRLVRHELRPDDFQSDHPGHPRIDGPVDLPHAAFADLLEDQVLAEEQFGDAAELDFAVLVAGEDTECVQSVRERSRFRSERGERARDRVELFRAATAPVAQSRQQGIRRESFHTGKLPP